MQQNREVCSGNPLLYTRFPWTFQCVIQDNAHGMHNMD